MASLDANFRWFEGEKAQYRFVPYDWAFLFTDMPTGRLLTGAGLELPGDVLAEHSNKQSGIDLESVVIARDQAGCGDKARSQYGQGEIESGGVAIGEGEEKEEHHGAAHGDGMHADLKIDIAQPPSA